nr:DUF6541 family protein [Microbacterium telephonicum]
MAAVIVAVVAFGEIPAADRISQTYDNVFHLSATARILADGNASSLTLRTITETVKTFSYYPAAWHTLVAAVVQTTGASIAAAANAAWIAVAAAVWLPGAAWLAQVLLPRFAPARVAVVALPLGSAFAAMPYSLLTWGTLYPTFLAAALLPVAVAAPVAVLGGRGRARRRGVRLGFGLGGAVSILALGAIGASQPRVLMTWAVIVAPFVAARAWGAYRRARRAGAIRRRRAGWWAVATAAATCVVVAGGFAFLVLSLGLFERPLKDRLGGPQAQATQSVADGLLQVAAQAWPTGVGSVVVVPSLLLALAVGLGLILAARRPELRWAVLSYAILAVLFALAAGADDVFAKLATALWYKDRYRLSSALPVLGVTFATLGILWLSRRLSSRRPRWRPLITLIAVVATVLSSAVGMRLGGVSASAAVVFRLPDVQADSAVVSRTQIDFMRDEVARIVPAGQRLLGDPWDGSALSEVYSGREPVFPHVNGLLDPDRTLLSTDLRDIDEDPAVCAALDSLRVRYVLYDPHEFGGGDPAGNRYAGVHAAVEAGLFTEIESAGTTRLYAIEQCGPLP